MPELVGLPVLRLRLRELAELEVSIAEREAGLRARRLDVDDSFSPRDGIGERTAIEVDARDGRQRLDVLRLEPERLLVFCDEASAPEGPVAALQSAPRGKLALLIGPEGGFDESERALVLARSRTLRLSLGPRILRADTAAVAAMAVIQAAIGDWT